MSPSRRRVVPIPAVVVGAVMATGFGAPDLEAQERRVSIFAGGGPAWPIEVMSGLWGAGAHVHAGGELWLSDRIAIGIAANVQRLPLDETREHTFIPDGTTYTVSGDDLEILQALVSLRWALPTPTEWRISPYIRGGVGYTELDTGRLVAVLRGEPSVSRNQDRFVGGLMTAGATYRMSDRLGLYSQVSIGFDLDGGIDMFAPASAGLEVRF